MSLRALRAAAIKTDVRLYDSDGYWRVRLYDRSGKRRFVRLGNVETVSRRQAEILMARLHEEAVKHPELRNPDGTITVDQWRQSFKIQFAHLEDRGLQQIDSSMRIFVAYVGERCLLSRLTRTDAADFMATLRTRANGRTKDKDLRITEYTARNHARRVRRVLREAWRQDLMQNDIFDRIPTAPPPIDHPTAHVTPELFAKLLAGVTDPGLRMMMNLCRWGGLRRGEASRLRWEDIDLKRKMITIANPGRVQTTKRRHREVPIRPELLKVLNAIPAGARQGAVAHFSLANATRDMRAAKAAAKVEDYGKPFHALRASAETEWIAAGIDIVSVARWLGHSPEVAMKHYATVPESAWNTAVSMVAIKPVKRKPR